MPKQINWAIALANTIKAANSQPFVWGKSDCCLFAADCIEAQICTDLAKDLRGRYRSQLGAARVLAKHGGIASMLDTHFKQIPLSHVQRGDVVLFEGPHGKTLGVYFSGVWAVTDSGADLVSETPTLVWRVE